MVTHAQELIYNLTDLMPTQYQKDNLEAMLGLFLEVQGHPLPAHCQTKSASADESISKSKSLVNQENDRPRSSPYTQTSFI